MDKNKDEPLEDTREMRMSDIQEPVRENTVINSDVQDSRVFSGAVPYSPPPTLTEKELMLLRARMEVVEGHRNKLWQKNNDLEQTVNILLNELGVEVQKTEQLKKELAEIYLILQSKTDISEEITKKLQNYQAENTYLAGKVREHEQAELKLLIRALKGENNTELNEQVIRMYEERFGKREDLYKLADLEEKAGKDNPKDHRYHTIRDLVGKYEGKEVPKTLGERLVSCAEELKDNILYMLNGFYNRIMGFEKKKK